MKGNDTAFSQIMSPSPTNWGGEILKEFIITSMQSERKTLWEQIRASPKRSDMT